jgi:uncharacterized protein
MFIKELIRDECFKILTEIRVGRIACARENQPYIVPFHYGYDGGEYLYAFSTFGQKIEWMRKNPKVCVEIDDINNQIDWTSLIIFGLYEELSDTPEFANERTHAHELLSRHPMWWQPAYSVGTHRVSPANDKPIYFRIYIDKVTGHRAVSE